MLSRADSYLDDALKLDCDERGDGSWGLSGPASTSPNVMDDALLNTTLSVIDFGTANDLEASTPISCGLGMAFVKDPSRPNQNKVSNTACAITCPPPLYPRRWTFTGPYLQWRGLISWVLWHITFFLLICFTFSYSWILPEHYKDNYHWFMWFFSLLFTLEVNWAARYMAVSRNVHVGEILCVDATAPSIQEDWNECTWLAIIAGYFYRLTPFVFVASATDLLLRVRYLYSPKEVWRFFKLYGMPLTYLLPFFLDTLPMILAGKAGYDNSLDFYYTHDGCHGASRTKTHSIYVEAGCYVVYFVVIFTALRDLHRNVRAVRTGVAIVVSTSTPSS